MPRTRLFVFSVLATVQFALFIAFSPPSVAQEWAVKTKPRGTIRVLDLWAPSASVMQNYAEGLVMLDKDNKRVPGLAKDWRWLDGRTIEFKLRQGVTFHNGEKFNAEAVRVNWEQYRAMENPRPVKLVMLSDEIILKIVDDYTVRFIFPEPDGLALVKLCWLYQFAPAFFRKHKFDEKNHAFLPKAGPWGTGPFKLLRVVCPLDSQVGL